MQLFLKMRSISCYCILIVNSQQVRIKCIEYKEIRIHTGEYVYYWRINVCRRQMLLTEVSQNCL